MRIAVGAALAMSLAGCAVQLSTRNFYPTLKAPPLSNEIVTQSASGFTLERLNFTSADGVALEGVYLRRPAPAGTVIFYGGNGFTVSMGATVIALAGRLNLDLLMADTRNHGPSGKGPVSVQGLTGDALAIYDQAAARVPADRLFLVGHSLGSVLASAVAVNRPAAGVVLISGITTVGEMIEGKRYGPVRLRVDPELASIGDLALVRQISHPTLFVVGAEDKLTPPRFSQQLYAESPLPDLCRTLVTIAGAGHDGIVAAPELSDAMQKFVAQWSGQVQRAAQTCPRR